MIAIITINIIVIITIDMIAIITINIIAIMRPNKKCTTNKQAMNKPKHKQKEIANIQRHNINDDNDNHIIIIIIIKRPRRARPVCARVRQTTKTSKTTNCNRTRKLENEATT